MTNPLDPLKKVAAKIGATRVVIPLGRATPMGTSFGIEGIDPEEIGRTSSEDALYYHGRAIVIYIKDHGYHAGTVFQKRGAGYATPEAWLLGKPKEGNKYHIAPCSTIEKMIREKRFGRYVKDGAGGSEVKLDGQGRPVFPIDLRESFPEVALHLCWNCIQKIGHEPPDLKAWLLEKTQSPRRGTQFPLIPQLTALSAPANDYTADWHNVSWRYRMSRNWICEICGKNFRGNKNELHAHHRNMQKGDNSESNLQALCETCHGKQHPGNPRFYIPDESS